MSLAEMKNYTSLGAASLELEKFVHKRARPERYCFFLSLSLEPDGEMSGGRFILFRLPFFEHPPLIS